jgi:hypothetical protein
MHEVGAFSLLVSKMVQQHPIMSKLGVRTLSSTIRSPLTGSDAEHAAVQASGIEKKRRRLIRDIQHLFVRRRDLVCLLQFTSSRTVVASRRSFGRAIFASTGNHCNCVDSTVSVVCRLFNHTGAQYSAVE